MVGRRRKVAVAEQEAKAPEPSQAKVPKLKEKPAKKFKNDPSWLEGEAANVAKLVLSIQKSDCNSSKIITELTNLYRKMGHEPFMAVFMKILMVFLMREENDECAPRVLKFIGTFVASFGEEVGPDDSTHLIIQFVFKELLSITSKLYYIRARICLLVTNIMISFSGKAEIDVGIMDHVIDRMISTFIKDVSPVVRERAILALQRLQDPDNSDDLVTRAYLYHMETDPVARVRMAAITAIAKKVAIMPHIIERLQDNEEKVRRHTYMQMASFGVKSYKIADRIKILRAGLYDRSDIVKRTVNNMLLPNWVAAYDYNYAEFIRAFKMDASDDDFISFRDLAQDALSVILKKRKISDLVAFLNLNKETNENGFKNCLPLANTGDIEWLIVWKIVIKLHHAHNEGRHQEEFGEPDDESSDEDKNETMSNIETIPELTAFCDYFEKFVDNFKITDTSEEKYLKLNFNHCVIVLLEIVLMNDFGDEIGRNRLQELLKKILIGYDVSEYVIEKISQVVELLITKTEARLDFYSEIVNEMVNIETHEYCRKAVIEELITSCSNDVRLEANRIKHQMMTFKEQEKKFVEVKQYAKAQIVSEEYLRKNEELIELLKPYAQTRNDTSLESLSSMAVSKKVTPAEILKNLRICYYAVVSKGVKALTPENVKIYNSFISYHLESKDVLTRIWAMKAATAYCLLYETFAKDVYAILKSQFGSSNKPMIWRTAISCIVDILLRYTIEKMDKPFQDDASVQDGSMTSQSRIKRGGRSLYTDDGEENEDMNPVMDVDIVTVLTHIIENNIDVKLQKATIIGLCKLLLHGRFYTREMMSRFLIMYFNPATEAELNQTLGIFFESIVKMKKQESLHDALFPTLVTLLEAPCDSPLREVKMENVIKYVIGATRPVFCSTGLNLHNTLALKLLEVMTNNPENKELLRIFSRELLTFEISEDPLLKKDIVAQIENLLKLISVDVRTKKNITDFRDILNGTYRKALSFSSTAKASVDPQNEDAGEDDDEDMEKSDAEDAPRLGAIEEASEADETVADPETIASPKASEIEAQNKSPVELAPATQENKEDEKPATEDEAANISLPATQDEASSDNEDAASEISSDVEANETVIQTKELDIVIESLPATPDDPKTPEIRRSAAFKRQLVLTATSRNSPQRKNPRNTATPKVQAEPLPKTPASRRSSVGTTTPKTPATRRQVAETAASQKTPVAGRKSVAATTPKTPATRRQTTEASDNQKTPRQVATPKTPRNTAPLDTSTPSSERMTRKQVREEIAQTSTLTRSASRKMKVDPKEVAEKAAGKAAGKAGQKAPSKPEPKVVKKSVIPVPTKTSMIRAKVADAKKPDPSKPSSSASEGRPPRRAAAQEGKEAIGKAIATTRRPRWT